MTEDELWVKAAFDERNIEDNKLEGYLFIEGGAKKLTFKFSEEGTIRGIEVVMSNNKRLLSPIAEGNITKNITGLTISVRKKSKKEIQETRHPFIP